MSMNEIANVPEQATNEYAIAVDFDGTLVEYYKWEGEDKCGALIKPMVEKCEAAVAEGKKLYIFSARCDSQESAAKVAEHCKNLGVDHLFSGYTNIKLKIFKEFWDDRAVEVLPNTGKFIQEAKVSGYAVQELCSRIGITEKALTVARFMSLPVFNKQVGGSHYKDMLIEPGIYCELNRLTPFESGVVKYVSRHRNKNGVQDVEKASHLIEAIKQTCYGEITDEKE